MTPFTDVSDVPIRIFDPDSEDENRPRGKLHSVTIGVLKTLSIISLLYVFICSLGFLSSSFRLLGGRAAGKFISNSELLQNPIVGLMIGVLVTVLVQSSSTSTSIVVTMVGSELIHVRQAIPIVMGANIGTSVTNTIVSLMQASDRDEFRRAFAAATVHDMFNWLTVIVLLPVEVMFGYLESMTDQIMALKEWKQDKSSHSGPDFIKRITTPFTDMIVKLDKKVLSKIALAHENQTISSESMLQKCCKIGIRNNTSLCVQNCNAIFNQMALSDNMSGIILLVLSLFLLCTCLILIVKILNSVLRGKIALIIKKYINSEYEFPMSMIVGYLAILIGCIMTILVQSSSIFTSALTPLAGIGVISLERIYPLTLGSNIGTTTTGIMAALAADPKSLRNTLQLAFCHLFFNITGILIFYPIPFMRFPIPMAKILGATTAKYRWFSIFYLLMMFFVLPFFVFTLSYAGKWIFISVGTPTAIIVIFAVIMNIIQNKKPSWLPIRYQDWNWLPFEWMHSLDPIDKLLLKSAETCSCLSCCLRAESRHDADALGIRANQSQLHILEAASKNMSASETNLMLHSLNYDNNGFMHWNNGHHLVPSNGSSPERFVADHNMTWHGNLTNGHSNGSNGHHTTHLQIPTSPRNNLHLHIPASPHFPESTKL